jgi:hypothetical protein
VIATVDWDALLQIIWTSIVAGIGVTAAFGIAILGATRAVDLRRAGQGASALVAGTVGVLGLAVVCGAIVFGIVVMTNK